MTPEIAITLGVLALVVFALTCLRAGPDLILLGGLIILLVMGVIEPNDALAGFANEGLITVAILFVVAEGLQQTGGISFIGQRLLGQPGSLFAALMRIMIPTATLSAFMNNTPVVAMFMPVLNDWAKKHRLSISRLLIPLSYSAILGGLCTLVGTSTTLVVNGLLIEEEQRQHIANGNATPTQFDASQAGLSMFEIAWVGVPIAIAGVVYLAFLSRFLLPERKSVMAQLDDPREYTVEMLVDPGSPLVGKSIEDAGLRHLPGMYLMEIDRAGHLLAAVSSNERVQANDRLVFVGIVESIIDLQKIPGLKPATDQTFKLESPSSERVMIEAVISNSCPFLRMTIREAKFRTQYNAAVIAVARNGQRLNQKIGDIEMLPGDTLLLEAHPNFVDTQRNSRDFFLVSAVENSTPPRHSKAWIARITLLAMVVLVAFNVLSMLKAAFLAAFVMVATRCCRGSEARQSIDWSVLLAIGAGLGIGKAMEKSEAAVFIAGSLIDMVGENPYLVLAMVYTITMVFTNLITAKAAAVLFFPIAMASATKLGVHHMPFAIAVMMAAAASFATPISFQTNLMVFGPGGYRFTDYARIGIPLSLIVALITVIIAPVIWPF